MTKAELKYLVGNEYLKETFGILKKATALDSRLHNRVITQSASFEKYSWSSSIGIISRPEEKSEHAQVVKGLLDTIDMVPAQWLAGIPFPPSLVHLLEQDPNSPPNPLGFASKYLWLLATAVVVLVGAWALYSYLTPLKSSYFPRMTVNLYKSDSNRAEALKSGQLLITFTESGFSKKSSISDNGQVFFDSIPLEWGKGYFTCQLVIKENYKLRDENQKYALAEDVNVLIEEAVVRIPPTSTESPCLTTSPDGSPLDKVVYKPHEKRLNYIWIPGQWKKEQGVCVWKAGHYEKLTLQTHADCPTEPPIGTTPDRPGEARSGYFWQPSRWVLQDGECTWRAGSWQKKQAD